MADSPKPKRRWYQYSLRTLLVLVTIIGGLLAYIRTRVDDYKADWREEQSALDAINRLFAPDWSGVQGNTIVVGPAWLRLLTPSDESKVFERVVSVGFNSDFPTNRDDTNALISNLKKLPHLQRISVCFGGIAKLPSPFESLLISLGALPPLPSSVNNERIQKELPNVVIFFYAN